MKNILVFAGTKEGRELAAFLAGRFDEVHVCVATEYGEEVIPETDGLVIHQGRLDVAEMMALFGKVSPVAVVDATHPYAKIVSENIIEACRKKDMKYYRLLRDSAGDKTGCKCFATKEEACQYLNSVSGNILLTTGSKELADYVALINDISRIYARFLPDGESIDKAKALGLKPAQLICMQGPFSAEMNGALLKQFSAKYLVSKDTGTVGGFPEKIEGAAMAGAEVVVINRPEEGAVGLSRDQILDKLGLQ